MLLRFVLLLAASLLPVEEAHVAVLADNRKQVGQVAVLSRRVGSLLEANRVLAADPRQDGYTLLNTLAQKQAAELLASANDYF